MASVHILLHQFLMEQFAGDLTYQAKQAEYQRSRQLSSCVSGIITEVILQSVFDGWFGELY